MAKKLTAYQAHMKRELKGKMKGKTKAQRKAIFKAAAKSYKGGSKKAKSRKSPKKSSKRSQQTKVRKVGKGGFNSQKIMKYVRLAALGGPAIAAAMGTGTPQEKVKVALRQYTGFDMASGQFVPSELAKGWTPYLAAVLTTYGIPKIAGIIRGL